MTKKLLIVLIILLSFSNLSAEKNKVDSIEQYSQSGEYTDSKSLEESNNVKIGQYFILLNELEQAISKEKVWTKSYETYLTALEVRSSLNEIKKRIKYLKKRQKKQAVKEELRALEAKEKIIATQVSQLKDNYSAPFSELITPPKIGEAPKISNPFDIFAGISFIKKVNTDFEAYMKNKQELTNLISLLERENKIYKSIQEIDSKNNYSEQAATKQKQLDRFKNALGTISAAAEVYERRLEVLEVNINKEIQGQVYKLAKIGILVVVVFFIFFLLKLAVKKYFTDNERFYMANKAINFSNFTLIILIVFFNYIENASYLVTILGFASAGIAIAMKDWFMSILGWLVIVFGGSIHVGDRIRVDMDGMKYVGDVMDISPMRMTILEDITLTSIRSNRRAGRIIFVPNNYVFTRMIANYTHSSLKTVWDGIKITITYESNHKKAMSIAKEIAKKYSKGYTDITRKQLNKLRHHYSLKNTSVEPRIFSFIESNGLDIEVWYLTNAYATLTLRSVISTEIVDAFKNDPDITIAYPTQMIHM
ncbi:MAG: mechanosensitive ion channel family protein, partial [Thiovulaceae bacterium]|nr:mechanosensitive ion channel family protein [Sulfurimonadaceae bacterium]